MSTDFLNFNLDDIPEQSTIEPCKGLVSIKSASVKTSKDTNRDGLNFMFIVENNPAASPIWHTLWLPKEGDNMDQGGNGAAMLNMLVNFYRGMGYDYSNITGVEAAKENIEELVDLQATASIGFQPANDAKGWAASNTIKSLTQG